MRFAADGLAHGTVQLAAVLWTALCIVVAAVLAETCDSARLYARSGCLKLVFSYHLGPDWI